MCDEMKRVSAFVRVKGGALSALFFFGDDDDEKKEGGGRRRRRKKSAPPPFFHCFHRSDGRLLSLSQLFFIPFFSRLS